MGPPRGRRRERLRALLRGAARQEGAHLQAQDPAQGRRRALPRHRRGPRGRGDRLAPLRRAEAEGHPGPPDGLPRDHQEGDPRGRRQPAPDQRRPRRGPGGAPHPRPPLRLRGLAGPLEEGHVRPVRRPRAVGGHPPGGRQGARADQVPGRVVLGRRGHLRRRRGQGAADVPGAAALHRRGPRRQRLRLRVRRRAEGQARRPRPPRPRRRRAARRGAARHVVRRPVGGGEALPPLAVRAVPHHDPPAGGQPQARHERVGDDVGRPAALRGRLHHLHADRLHDAVGAPRSTRRGRRSASSTGRSTSPTSRAPTPRRSRTPRRRTRRSGRRATRSARPARPG